MLNNTKKVKYIYHIGDIHIRKNSDRDEEYKRVFDRTCKKISKLSGDGDNSIILCAGDVFHDGLSPTSIMLAKNFFVKLCEICDVVVYRGNHDQSSRSNSDAIDFLYPILYKLETKNKIHILDKTGTYEYGNIVFGYTDVYDKHVYTMDSVRSEKNATELNGKVTIGLWHGIISGCKNDDGIELSERAKFSCDDFEEYDYVMLGDIHKMQYIGENKKIAYCGSLIQQNYGESLTEHGFIEWNIKDKTSKFVRIGNDHGFVTVNIMNDKVSEPTEMPKNVNLRIIHRGTSDECIKMLKDKISITSSIVGVEEKKEQTELTFDNVVSGEMQVEQDAEMTIQRLVKYVDENCENTKNSVDDISDTLKRIVGELDYNYDTHKKSIKLKSLMFKNFNVYGDKNCIDYASMNGIMNVCGKNGIGKSSAAVYVLLYAIYGACEDSSISRYEYVNNKKHDMMTSIIVEVNGVEYKIHRTAQFKDKRRTTKNFSHTVTLYKNGVNISGKDIAEINKQITEIIGTSNDLVNLCIMEQKKSSSFLSLSDVEKKDYICDVLKLDVYGNIQDALSQETRVYNSEIATRNKRIYDDPKNKCSDRTTNIKNEIDKINQEIGTLEIKLRELHEKYDGCNKSKIETDVRLSDLKGIDFGNVISEKESQKRIKRYESKLEIAKSELEQLTIRLKKNQRDISKYVDMEVKKSNFDAEKDEEMHNIGDQINALWKKYVDVADEHLDIEHTIDQKKEQELIITDFGGRIKNNNDEITKLIHDVEEYETDIQCVDGYRKFIECCEKMENMKRKRSECSQTISEIKKKHCDIDASKTRCAKRLEKLIAELDALNVQIGNMVGGNPGERMKPLLAQIKERMSHYKRTFDDKMISTRDAVIALEKWMKIIDDELYDAYKTITELEEHMADDTNVQSHLDSVIVHKNMLKFVHDIVLDRITQIETSSIAHEENNIIDGEISELCEQMDKIGDEHDAHECKKLLKRKTELIDEIKMVECEIRDDDKILHTIMEHEDTLKCIVVDIERVQIEQQKYSIYAKMHEEHDNSQKKILQLREDNVKLRDRIEIAKGRVTNMDSIIKKYNDNIDIIKQNKRIKKEVNELTIKLDSIKNKKLVEYETYMSIKTDVRKLQTDIANAKLSYKEIDNKLEEAKDDSEKNRDIAKKKCTYDELVKSVDEIEKNISQLSSDIGVTTSITNDRKRRAMELEKELNSIDDAKKEIVEFEKKRQLNVEIIDIIKNGFVDNLLTHKIIPNFCANVNNILSSFVDFSITMEYDNKKLYVYKKDKFGLLSSASKLSGYETLMANVAFRLAVNNINRLYKTNFFIMDEVFAFCDEHSIAKISNLFTYMKKMYDFVIVVSHNEQIKSYTDVDIPIVIVDGCSNINMQRNGNNCLQREYDAIFGCNASVIN